MQPSPTGIIIHISSQHEIVSTKISNTSKPDTLCRVRSGADLGFDQGGGPDRDRPKTAILGPQFCRILVLGPHFWWSGRGARAPGPPLDPPLPLVLFVYNPAFIL